MATTVNQSNILIAAGLAAALFTSTEAGAATLPLQDGEYTRGACKGGSDITESIGIYTLTSPQRGTRVLSPNGDGQDGYCKFGDLRAVGNRYSGDAECSSGTRIDSPTGTYRFAYDVIDNKTFISRGKTYRWCAKGR
jgi:hypothetical protein